jgi:hypothetical protein
VFRFLVVLLGLLTTNGSGRRTAVWHRADNPDDGTAAPALRTGSSGHGDGGTLPYPPGQLPPWQPDAGRSSPASPEVRSNESRRRRRISPWVKRGAVVLAVGLIFRRAISALVMIVLSGALHLVGLNVHLPNIRFAWPWQTISAGTTTNADLGPWVLQKIEGISRPALGQANLSFFFTHKVSKSIGPWPCWYASTFYAVGRASATVDLNPGPGWWSAAAGHYRLQVLGRPHDGKPGHVAVMMVLPQPQLPQSVHDVTIDDIPSKPIDTQHSWTYPGFGCGVVLRPQFPQSVLYSQAQAIAFHNATHSPQIVRSLINSAETEAARTVRDNFIQPTVNAFGYSLDQFTIRWAAPR